MDLETNVRLNEWFESLGEDGKTQHELMKAWCDNKCAKNEVGCLGYFYRSTNEIIDELFDMGHLDMTFVQTWMRLAGFVIVNVDGQYRWRLWLVKE